MKQNDSLKIGEYLKSLRKQKGYTLIQLQKESGVSNSYLSQVENNQFIPSSEVLRKLSEPLEVPYHELMYRAGHIPKEMYEKQSELEEGLKLRESMVDDVKEDLTHVDTVIKSLRDQYHKLESITTGQPYDEDNREMLTRIKSKIEQHESYYNGGVHTINTLLEDIRNHEVELKKLNNLIEKREKTTNIQEKDKIQSEIDEHMVFIDEIFENDQFDTLELTVNIPIKYEYKDKNGVSIIKEVRTEEEVFDLDYLLNANLKLHYKGQVISQEDKDKISTMIDMILK